MLLSACFTFSLPTTEEAINKRGAYSGGTKGGDASREETERKAGAQAGTQTDSRQVPLSRPGSYAGLLCWSQTQDSEAAVLSAVTSGLDDIWESNMQYVQDGSAHLNVSAVRMTVKRPMAS